VYDARVNPAIDCPAGGPIGFAVSKILGDESEPYMREMAAAFRSGRITDADEYLVANVAKEYCHWLDNGRQFPDPKPSREMLAGRDVLDVGCSFGRWLWYLSEHARSAVGLEMQGEYVEMGRAIAEREGLPAPTITVGDASMMEQFYQPESFDLIFSRLVWNYLPIADTLRQAHTLLRPGGTIWIRPLAPLTLRGFIHAARRHAGLAWMLFALANSCFCNLTGQQIKITCRGRMHHDHYIAHPSAATWRRLMRRVGFVDIDVSHVRAGLIVRGRRAIE
jgi:SAM-dependent methyltransferase